MRVTISASTLALALVCRAFFIICYGSDSDEEVKISMGAQAIIIISIKVDIVLF